jgi:hypothetical protein
LEAICRVFKKPFKLAVAGYGVFNWVKGGVINKRFGCKAAEFTGENTGLIGITA